LVVVRKLQLPNNFIIVKISSEKKEKTVDKISVVTNKFKPIKFLSCVVRYMVLFAMSAVAMLPFAWMLSSSFKLDTQVFVYPIEWIPKNPRWINYTRLFERFNFFMYFRNTLFVSVMITAGTLVTSIMAAYSFAKIQFRGRDKLFLLYLSTLMIPWQVIMIPQFLIVNGMHLNDSHMGLIITHIFTPFGVFLLKQFFMSVPNDYVEAAKIDGYSELCICFSIIVPMSKPALTSLVLFTFMGSWNDYLAPLIFLKNKNLRTLQIGLHYFQGEHEVQWSLLMAGAFVSMIPVMLFYIFAQKQLIAGMASGGGLKG
jgi:multiple sugar transport system permease protein